MTATSSPAQRHSRARQLSFWFPLAGVASVLLVTVTPIGARSADLFWCHMVQHVTLLMISGPLFALGTASTFHPKNLFFTTLTDPVVSWVLYATVMIGVHLPVPHEFIMNHPWIHSYVEIPAYIIFSYFFYFNLLDRNMVGRRISPAFAVISLFLMMVPETLTGFFIYTAPNSLYNNMFTLDDQRRGGSIMWSGGMIIDAIWIALAVHHWFQAEERKSFVVDAQIATENS
jgi:putative copper resistance protein D